MSSISIQTFGYAAEAYVFSFIGLTSFFYADYPFCWTFIVVGFFIIVVGRYFGIVSSYYMFSCFSGSPENYLSFREISFATYAAFIRGAIAFGLVEMLDEHTFKYKRVIVSSTMVLVIASTCIFGGFTPIVLKFLLPSKEVEVNNVDDVNTLTTDSDRNI